MLGKIENGGEGDGGGWDGWMVSPMLCTRVERAPGAGDG